jgi:hypothetical protein
MKRDPLTRLVPAKGCDGACCVKQGYVARLKFHDPIVLGESTFASDLDKRVVMVDAIKADSSLATVDAFDITLDINDLYPC